MKNDSVVALAIGAFGIVGTDARAQKPAESATPAQHEHKAVDSQHAMMKGMTDASFVPMMIQHHQQGIEMARVEEEKGSSADVKALAAKIRQSQEKEIAELQAHKVEGSKDESKHAERHKMMEQQGDAMIDRLKSASGQSLDHAFLQNMAKHHEMAIHMIDMTKFEDAELSKMAEKMKAGQQKELKELKQLQSAHK